MFTKIQVYADLESVDLTKVDGHDEVKKIVDEI